jgi:hypothetical protein
MKHYLVILFLLLTACGKGYVDIYTNPATTEVGVFMDNEGAESTPILWHGRVVIVTFNRPASGYYVTLTDMETKTVIATLQTPDFTTGCAIVAGDRLYIYGTSGITVTGGVSFNNNTISVITTDDLVNWTPPYIVHTSPNGTAAWNVSVTETNDGYVMAYDYSQSPSETSSSRAKFLYSQNLVNWQDWPGLIVGNNNYLAAVTLRYSNGFYYAMFVQSYDSAQGRYLPNVIMRSTDLTEWTSGIWAVESPLNHPDYLGSATDADMVEVKGKVLIVYLTGDQGGPAGTKIRIAEYPGTMDAFLSSHF